MAALCAAEQGANMKPLPKGPQGPRRSPQQAASARREAELIQQAKDEEMTRKMQEAYKKAQSQPLKKGGMTKGIDGCAMRGRTRA